MLGGFNLHRFAPNPTGWIDPMGLVIKPVGTAAEVQSINDSLGKLSTTSPTAQGLIQNLQSSPHVVTIQTTTGGNTYTPSNRTVAFNPNTTQIGNGSEAWMRRPPEIGLAHELVHAVVVHY